jgi:predicted tellurium resistance membrane protein TerC
MRTLADKRRDRITVVGLAIGGIFRMAGSFVTQAQLRQLFWMLDGVGLIVAAALLAVKFFRRGNDTLAASFLVFLAAESLVLPDPPSSAPPPS